MKEDIMFFLKFNTGITRATQVYFEKELKKYQLSSGSYPYLLILDKKEGINQNEISCELGQDKAMAARTVSKLIQLDYLYKKVDEKDSRAYKLYLTEKGKKIIPELRKEIYKLIDLITEGLSKNEKEITVNSLEKILFNIKRVIKGE